MHELSNVECNKKDIKRVDKVVVRYEIYKFSGKLMLIIVNVNRAIANSRQNLLISPHACSDFKIIRSSLHTKFKILSFKKLILFLTFFVVLILFGASHRFTRKVVFDTY